MRFLTNNCGLHIISFIEIFTRKTNIKINFQRFFEGQAQRLIQQSVVYLLVSVIVRIICHLTDNFKIEDRGKNGYIENFADEIGIFLSHAVIVLYFFTKIDQLLTKLGVLFAKS